MTRIVSSKSKTNFTQISNSIIDDNRLSFCSLKILLHILKYKNAKSTRFSRAYFAKVLSVTEETVKRAMRELVKLGYARKGKSAKGDYSSYTFFENPQENLETDSETAEKGEQKCSLKRNKNVPLLNKEIKCDLEFLDFPQADKLPETQAPQTCEPLPEFPEIDEFAEKPKKGINGNVFVPHNSELGRNLYLRLEKTPLALLDKQVGRFNRFKLEKFCMSMYL